MASTVSKYKPVRFGIIGCGMIGEIHMQSILKHRNARLVGVSDLFERTIDNVKAKYGIDYVTTNYKQLLARPDIDAVIVATPPPAHKRVFIDALNAGKHTLVEKPIAVARRDLGQMMACASRHPELVVCDCSCRHSRLQPKFGFVKKYIDSGRLGEVYYIHHNAVGRQGRPGIEYHPSAKWFLDKKKAGGGPFFDWGVYDLSFHLGLLSDKPKLSRVWAFTRNGLDKKAHGGKVFDVEEHGVATMEFDTGLKYCWERAAHANNSAPNETRIYGTRGGIKLSYCTWESNEVIYYDVDKGGRGTAREKRLRVPMDSHSDDHFPLIDHFVRVVQGREKPAMPIETAAKHLDIIFTIYESARRNQTVKV